MAHCTRIHNFMNDFWIHNQLPNDQAHKRKTYLPLSFSLSRAHTHYESLSAYFSPSLSLSLSLSDSAAGQSAVINQIVTFVYFAPADDSHQQSRGVRAFNTLPFQLQLQLQHIAQLATICNGNCVTSLVTGNRILNYNYYR